MSLCLYSCVIYATCKTHTPHYVAICDLTGCTTLSHKRHDFPEKIEAQITIWISLQAVLKHFKYIQLHIVINVQRFSCKVWLFCEFLIQVEFFTLTFGKCSKTQSDECPNIWREFVLTGRKALKKPVLVSINFAFALKRYIYKSSTQNPCKFSLRS